MEQIKKEQCEKQYLLTEIARLDETLQQNGISLMKKRRDICEKYFFDYCTFLDEGQVCVSEENVFVTLAFTKKSADSGLHESILSIVDEFFSKKTKPANSDAKLPTQTPLAFHLILKPEKHSPIYVSIFESSSDMMIISRIQQSLVGHLYSLGALKSVNDESIYKKMDLTIPLHKIHPSLTFSEGIGVQMKNESKIKKKRNIDLVSISINGLMSVAKEILEKNSASQPSPKGRN